MAKINRQGVPSNVTTIVGADGQPELVDLIPENQQGTEEVEYDEDGEPVERDDSAEVDESDSGMDDTTPQSQGPTPSFEAIGSAEVVAGEQPPVDRSIDDVKSWVGDDYVKAERALEAERAGRNRSSLVTYLEKVAAAR